MLNYYSLETWRQMEVESSEPSQGDPKTNVTEIPDLLDHYYAPNCFWDRLCSYY